MMPMTTPESPPASDIRQRVGAQLRAFRVRKFIHGHAFGGDDMGARLGITKNGVYAIETGRSGASLDVLERMAQIVDARLVVTVRAEDETADEALLDAAVPLDVERRAMLLDVARAMEAIPLPHLAVLVSALTSTAAVHRAAGDGPRKLRSPSKK